MTLNETLLQKLADWHPPAGRQILTLPEAASGWALTVTTDRHDELGSLVWELSLDRSQTPAKASLGDWAIRVASHVTSLLEPLKVLEVDNPRGEALLRSNQPSVRSEKLFYYEVLLKNNNRAEIRRYHAAHQRSERRLQVAFALTNEALAKLVADLTADK
jgi:hypothetical protein